MEMDDKVLGMMILFIFFCAVMGVSELIHMRKMKRIKKVLSDSENEYVKKYEQLKGVTFYAWHNDIAGGVACFTDAEPVKYSDIIITVKKEG